LRLRIGELLALRRELQDLQAGVFRVKGSAWEGKVIDSSEEKQHERIGPIPPSCLELVRSMPKRIDSPWLFPTRRGHLWQLNNFYRDVWRPTREASGIDATPHDFRHSWETNLSAAGIDVADLADIAGHSVELAQARYRHALHRSFDQVRKRSAEGRGRILVASSENQSAGIDMKKDLLSRGSPVRVLPGALRTSQRIAECRCKRWVLAVA
jgi:integrase